MLSNRVEAKKTSVFFSLEIRRFSQRQCLISNLQSNGPWAAISFMAHLSILQVGLTLDGASIAKPALTKIDCKPPNESYEMSVDTRDRAEGIGFKFPISSPTSKDLANKIELTYDKMGYRSLSDVYCETDDDNHITLRGSTATFYLKQVAQVIAAKVAGVGSITNQIEVLN